MTYHYPVHVRFIEFMPLDRRVVAGRPRAGPLLPAGELRRSWRYELEPVEGPYGHGPAQYWRVPGAPGTIGFIAGVSEHFCESCNRLRLTADGRLRTCLFSGERGRRAAAARAPERLLRGARRGGLAGKAYDRCRERARQPPLHVTDRRLTMSELTHIDERGRARMVDVGAKAETEREARGARRRAHGARRRCADLRTRQSPKGDVLAVARLAGIMAAKRTHELIPLCHPLP